MNRNLLSRTFLALLLILCVSGSVLAAQTCKPDSIQATTPNTQLVDNGDGTISDTSTHLMWKKCEEGLSGNNCEVGSREVLTWPEALAHAQEVNTQSYAGYDDWRLPNIKELVSIIEYQCIDPAINLDRFPNTVDYSNVWSSTPAPGITDSSWMVSLGKGKTSKTKRNYSHYVRLVRHE